MENLLIIKKSKDYELIDSGDGEKLERYGKVILSRPDPQALWPKSTPEKWQSADATFTRAGVSGKWKINEKIPESWHVSLGGVTFSLKLLPSKHVGLFPEQSAQWQWIAEKITARTSPVSVLNLFGYSGGATLACAKAGASVCHVDSSKFAVNMAHKNAEISGLSDKPIYPVRSREGSQRESASNGIRFIVDDARKFVEREIKRGKKYDIILLDPPIYGKGVKKEVWNIENDLMLFLLRLGKILSSSPVAIVLSGYASGYSHITYAQMLQTITSDLNGKISSGELAIQESNSERLLPSGIFARWGK